MTSRLGGIVRGVWSERGQRGVWSERGDVTSGVGLCVGCGQRKMTLRVD